jgi:4a-hydroxytetrahydrobiopterin dehydratase
MQLQELLQKHSTPGGKALDESDIAALLTLLPGWERSGHEIVKTYSFKNYYETLAFVNALAYVAHHEDHHPDLGVHYNRCKVAFSTHDAGGLTLNDFICAAKIEQLHTR